MRRRKTERETLVPEELISHVPLVDYYDSQGRPLPELLTVQELATLVMVDPTTVRRWIAGDLLGVVSLPHRGSRQAYRIGLPTVVALLKLDEGERVDLLTVRMVSQALRVDETTVRRWIKNQALEAVSLPQDGKRKVYRVKHSTLRTLLQSPANAQAYGEKSTSG